MKTLKYSLVATALGLAAVNATAATYQVVDLGGADVSRHSTGLGLNNNDAVVGVAVDHFNYPVDLENLNVTALTLPDGVTEEDVRSGNFDATMLAIIKTYLDSNSSKLIQPVGDQSAFIADASGTNELTLLDQVDPVLNSKTRTTLDRVNAINDDGVTASTATSVYQKTDFLPVATDTNPEPDALVLWIRDGLAEKGVITKGEQSVVVTPVADQFGGVSQLSDISNSGYVVGRGSSVITTSGQTALDDNCGDITDTLQLNNCALDQFNNLAAANTPMFETRAYRWKIDDALNITETTDLGLSITPAAGDTRRYRSYATGVNEQGHVAAVSGDLLGNIFCSASTREYASYYNGDSLVRITGVNDYCDSQALDINDNNVVVGFASKLISSRPTPRFFYYDGDSGALTVPNGFFSSSGSEAHGINNAGVVVGHAQIDSSFSGSRREVGFTYDIATDTITDLNDLTTCDSPYSIVRAMDINDGGVIAGTALLTVDKRDAKGEVLTNDDGTVQTEEVTRAVKLMPIAGGSIDDCEVSTAITGNTERQGAGLGFYSLLLMLGLFARRRLVR